MSRTQKAIFKLGYEQQMDVCSSKEGLTYGDKKKLRYGPQRGPWPGKIKESKRLVQLVLD